MIKFFRRIRRTLLSENKFSKYLLYALGEIILVVIGILLALQINNWNEQRKETEIIEKYVQRLIEDLNKDLDYYKRRIAEDSVHLLEVAKIRDTFINTQSRATLKFVLEMELDVNLSELYVSDKTYEEMVSTGILYAIKEKEVREEIQEYYNWSAINQYYVKATNNDFVEIRQGRFYKYLTIADHLIKKRESVDHLDLSSFYEANGANNIQLQSYLITCYQLEKTKMDFLKEQMFYAKKLTKILNDSY